MRTQLTSAHRAAISLIVAMAIDVTLHGKHGALAEYHGTSHAVFVTTCPAEKWLSQASEMHVAWLARDADEDEATHKDRITTELNALYDHLKSLLPEHKS